MPVAGGYQVAWVATLVVLCLSLQGVARVVVSMRANKSASSHGMAHNILVAGEIESVDVAVKHAVC